MFAGSIELIKQFNPYSVYPKIQDGHLDLLISQMRPKKGIKMTGMI